MSEKSPEKLFLIDGSGYIFRAFHAFPPMSRSDGTPVNAVYGFSSMLMKLLDDLLVQDGTELIAVIFDAGRKTFRNDIYLEYKAHRPEPPEELVPQFKLIRDATRAFNIACIEKEGFEADDLIATYARKGASQGISVTIVSMDKDLMQLIGTRINMLDPMKNRIIGPEQVLEKFGVMPDKVIDVQSLAGDPTDNVPGVPGIGVKTAAALINQYGDLDTVLAKADEIKQPKRRINLIENADLARISRDLVTLKDDVAVAESLMSFSWKAPKPDVLLGFLRDQEFRSLIPKASSRFDTDSNETTGSTPIKTVRGTEKPSYDLVRTEDELRLWVESAFEEGIVAIDTETNSLNALQASLVGISLSVQPGKSCYIPLAHKASSSQGTLNLDREEKQAAKVPDQLPLAALIRILKPLLEDPGVLKIGHNIKYDMHILSRVGINIHPIDDTIVLSYVIDGSKHRHNMDALAQLHLDHTNIKFSDVCGSGKNQITFDRVPLKTALDYAAEDADITKRLHVVLTERLLEERLVTVYQTLDRPLITILTQMEKTGIRIDVGLLKSLSKDFSKRMADLEVDIYSHAGREFNVGSPKQLGEVLFDEIGLKGGKRSSKTGAYSTGADILEDLASQGHPLPSRVLDWRQLSKLKSTYTDTLIEQMNPDTGRVHTTYSQTVASTGRLSSNDPNLQNIPIRSEDGRKIRAAFVANEGSTLLSADYSQIELRLVAHVANIKALKEAFRNGEDIHASTASVIFDVPITAMDPMIRRRAKAINFGIIYGISAFGLARQLAIPRSEAAAFMESYFQKFPEIQDYMDRTKAVAKKQGFVITPFGRRCYTPGILDRNPNVRGFSERAAINAPIQGGAADIIKRAMIRIPDALRATRLSANMLLQVHDELVFEVPKDELDQTKEIVRTVMESAAHLDVPLVVDIGTGHTWADAH